MKKIFVLALIVAVGSRGAGSTGSLQAEENFSKAVRAEDFSAAGLGKLSPDELARLDALVRDYKSGALLAAKREAEAAEQARAAAEARAAKLAADAQAAADARAVKSAAESSAAPTEKKSDGGFFAKAKALLPAGTEVEYAAIEGRLVGDFTGWQAKTVFQLDNGQRWQVANPGNYFTPAIKNPAVKISPASFGGYWMTVEGVNQRVKVVRVDTGK